MPYPKFDYLKPDTLEEATDILAQYEEDAKIIAGGSDLLPDLRARLIEPRYLVDVKEIEEMKELSYDDEKGLTIGAAVSLNEIAELDIVKEIFKPLWSSVTQLADPTIRNRATLVGNICTASPAGDSAPSLLVLDAEVNAVSESGERKIPIQDFFTGVKRNSLGDKELVKSVTVPTPPETAVGDYLKWRRTRGEDLSLVGVAALVTEPPSGILKIALSSVAPIPIYISEAEEILKDKKSVDAAIEKAVAVVKEKISPITDVRCGESYRLHMAEVLTRNILKKLLEER